MEEGVEVSLKGKNRAIFLKKFFIFAPTTDQQPKHKKDS